jgi:hypothetical protein
MPSSTGLTGAAGEYHVAAELSRRDWLATVTIKNASGTDVLAQRRDRRRMVSIQAKTASPGNMFRLSIKDEEPGETDNEWYVLVGLAALVERPSFYILPRHVASAMTYLEHREWLADMGVLHTHARAGHQRKANDQRTLHPEWIEGYRERWELLDDSSWAAPFAGDERFLLLATEIPLPRNYPPLDR